MEIETCVIGILIIGIAAILLMIKQQLDDFKEELSREWIDENEAWHKEAEDE